MTDSTRTDQADQPSDFEGYPVLPRQADHRVVIPAPPDLLVWSEEEEHCAVLALDVETDDTDSLGVLVLFGFGAVWTRASEWRHWCWQDRPCPTPSTTP